MAEFFEDWEDEDEFVEFFDNGLEKDLAKDIIIALGEEFERAYLSKNLINTVKIEERPGGDGYNLIIPADLYDIDTWRKKKVIVYKGSGSYASKIDKTGGFSGKHKGYILKNIRKGISKMLKDNVLEAKIKGIKLD